jgi:adenylate cyclase
MFAFKTIQRRVIVLLVVPMTLFLLAFGVFGYHFIQNTLLKEWQEVAILQMERAAHQLDMKLTKKKEWMAAFARAGQSPHGQEIQQWLLQQIKSQPGVDRVSLTWKKRAAAGGGQVARSRSAGITPVQYFYPLGLKTVGLRAQLLDQAGRPLGRLEVILTDQFLVRDIIKESWLTARMACLVTDRGRYLAHTNPAMEPRYWLGETSDPLEIAMLQDLRTKPYGTIMGKGYIPQGVIGYYKLSAAPWAIMLHAQGVKILAPILRFRVHYLGSGFLCLLIILLLMRLGMKPVIMSVRRIAGKASQVAQGNYGEPLGVTSKDEIGQLTASFNNMIAGLKERDFISNTFGRYVDQEIAQELLRRPEASRLGGVKREVVILFADIRGFTPIAETLSPEATIHLVNRHFARMIDVIQNHRGIIVDFLGDAILAFFDPLDGPLEPVVQRAIIAALQLQVAIEAENLAEPKYPALHMGIGLNVGEVVVGNIGSESRAKYGIIGSAVNLTHRIQGQAQGGEVVVSEMVLQHCATMVAAKRTFQTKLKGIAHPVTLYVVENLAEPVSLSHSEKKEAEPG